MFYKSLLEPGFFVSRHAVLGLKELKLLHNIAGTLGHEIEQHAV